MNAACFLPCCPPPRAACSLAVILGIGRAIGETMAVVMVAGNQTWMPKGLFQGLRTMTSNIVIEMGYAADLHREALIATGVVLFVFILSDQPLLQHRERGAAKMPEITRERQGQRCGMGKVKARMVFPEGNRNRTFRPGPGRYPAVAGAPGRPAHRGGAALLIGYILVMGIPNLKPVPCLSGNITPRTFPSCPPSSIP